MSIALEKVYLQYILENPIYFSQIPVFYFKRDEIGFVYKVVREHWQKTKKNIPSRKQILDMVQMADSNGRYPESIIKPVLEVDLNDYDHDDVENWFKAWTYSNKLETGLAKAVEEVRNLDFKDLENTELIAQKIRALIENSSLLDMGNDNDFLDFDNPEHHKQPTAAERCTTGYSKWDELLKGGWSKKTLNILVGETHIGKSTWMTNLAARALDAGKNVLYITLEESPELVMKKLACIRMGLDLNDYDNISKDGLYVRNQISQLKQMFNGGGFNSEPGKLFIKEFPMGSATPYDIDHCIEKATGSMGREIDLVFIDYLGIMSSPSGTDVNSLYLKGKAISEGLRGVAQKRNVAMVTATQLSKDKYNLSDFGLEDIPESKAIAENSDTVWGIIRTEAMKKALRYLIKPLKIRIPGVYFSSDDKMAFNFILKNGSLDPVIK